MALFGRLFEGKEKRQQRELVDAEVRVVQAALDDVYGRNNSAFLDREGAIKLAMDQVVYTPARDVAGLFALGVAMQAIEKLPPLPTPPYGRAYIHLMRYFTYDDTPFERAQERVITIKEQVESLDRVAAWIVDQGREATNDQDDTGYLTRCFEAVERHHLINEV